MWWQDLLKFVASAGLITWLAKQVISRYFDRKAEEHRQKLEMDLESFKATTAKWLETFKQDLRIEELEHEIRFRRVDEKVAEHLAEVYGRLYRLYEAVHAYLNIAAVAEDAERREAVDRSIDELYEHLMPNRLYVPPLLYKQVRDCARKLKGVAKNYTKFLDLDVTDEERFDREFETRWAKSYNALDDIVDPLFTAIVAEIQHRLGVTD